MKGKKFFIITLILVLLGVGGYFGYTYAINPTIPTVNGLKASDCTDSTITLEWKKAEVDGYFIYQKTDEVFEKIATIKNPSKTAYVVKDLNEAQPYEYYVSSYFDRLNRIYECEEHKEIRANTIPVAQEIKNIDNEEPLELTVTWCENKVASGYEIQYIEGAGDNFDSAVTLDNESNEKFSVTVKELKENTEYTFRVRSYALINKEKVYGQWSKTMSSTVLEPIKVPEEIDPKKPVIALTFDDGPGYNEVSDEILDILEKYNVKATFFMVGNNAKDHPKNLKRKVKLGMEIGNHTLKHNHIGSQVTESDIKKSSDLIYKACGVYPTAFRSPGGSTTQLIRDECKKEKMALYYWSVDTEDWKYKDANKIYKTVMKNVSDGDIILMHDLYPTTAKAVKKMIPALIKKGYQFVTCQELVLIRTGEKPKAGQQYIDADTINNNTY